MYRFWKPIIEPLLERLEPHVIVEIGSDQGLNTGNLLEYGRRSDAVIHVIDPFPKYDVDEWLEEYPKHLVFHRAISLDALGAVKSPDVVLIDGDHNWHTVFHELEILEDTAEDGDGFPFVLIHDVGWPYGRRDLYYEPGRIPAPHRHPHRQEGMRPGRVDLDPGGGLNRHLFNARHEGGPRNGVLTAVEDFMDQSGLDLRLLIVPGINSLALIYEATLEEPGSPVVDLLEAIRSGSALKEVLEKVEELRLEAQVESIDRQVERDSYRAALVNRESEMSELRKTLDSVSRERDAARNEVAHLNETIRTLRADELESRQSEMAAQSDLRELQAEHRSIKRELATSSKQTASVQRRYNRLQSRRSVRFALRMASLAGPPIRAIRRMKSGGSPASTDGTEASGGGPSPRKAPTSRTQQQLTRAIISARPGSTLTDGPLVSIVILTRDGEAHMRRVLASLDESTAYRAFEVIVVDNGSTDETSQVLAQGRGFPLRVIRNDHNTSFSHGNNQAANVAEGQFLLFLNNDIEPINPGWLGALVEVLQGDASVAAVGAELVYPVRGNPETDLTVQHSGIRFGFREGAVHPVNVQEPDPLAPSLADATTVPAATAAVLLVRAEPFRSVSGFDESYVYGTEDVELCLALRPYGRVVVTGQAVLFHHESATQSQVAAQLTNMNRRRNHQHLAETRGPRLTRSVRRDILAGTGLFSGKTTRTVALTVTQDDASTGWGDYYTAHELGDSFAAEGWNVIYIERHEDGWYQIDGEVDLLISLLDSYDVTRAPDGAFTIAWVRNWVDRWLEKPWFEAYDMVIASSEKGADFISRRSRYAPPRIPLATNAKRFRPGPSVPTFESDYVFTGNKWGVARSLVGLLDVHPGERFQIFGKGWESDPRVSRYWRGSLDYDLLPDVYRSSRIVLDDTAIHTLPYAFMNSRVFDALASGTLVLTNNVEGSEELFGGLLPTYTGREDLRSLLDRYLDDDEAREQLAGQLREEVLANHTYARRPAEILHEALGQIELPRCAIKIGVPDREVMPYWGDSHFASGLAAALTQLGMPTEVHILPEWDLPAKQAVDVVIHLRGLSSYTPKPAHLNILWLVSHPNDVSVRECEKYDLILVASRRHADWLQGQTQTPVVFMPQATDHRRFHPVEPDAKLASDVVFLGNSRGQRRPAVDWAIERGLPLAVYGGGWAGRIPARHLKGDLFPNEDLARLYASAKVVLNDHWPDMRDLGFVSNRIFDVFAAGGIVVSDPVAGLDELFGDLVPVYSDPEQLEEAVRELITDDDRRKAISHEAQALVAAGHTFSHRAAQMMDLIQPMLASRPLDLESRPIGEAATGAERSEPRVLAGP